MTWARMVQLKEALERAGWEISGECGAEIFDVAGDRIAWELSRPGVDKTARLTFYLFDHLGRRTEKLADIAYVMENERGLKLYFSKITTEEWKSDLRKFVRRLYPEKGAVKR